MITARTLVIVVLGLGLSTRALQGQDRSRYRDFQVGGDVPSVSPVASLANVAVSDAKTIHQRPAVIQELRSPYLVSGSTALQTDPVQQIVFSLDNDQLSRMVAYNRDRTGTSHIDDKGILPWGLRRAGAGVGLTVSGVNISIQRNGFKLSKSVTF